MKLTEKFIKYFQPGAKEEIIWGNGGFGLRVAPDGKKTFILEYRLREEFQIVTLGTYPEMSFADARKLAVKAFEKILNKTDSVEKKAAATLVDTESEKKVEKKAVPEETETKITETKVPEAPVATPKPVAAPSLPKPPIVKSDPLKVAPDPVVEKEVPPSEEEKVSVLVKEGGRILSKSELKIFWNGLPNSLMPPRSQLALKMMMVTAQPCEEVVVAKWADFDLVGRLWNIPAAQTVDHKKHTIPLTNFAMDMLRKIKEVGGAGGILFPGGPGPILDTKSLDGDLHHAQFRMNMGSFTVEDLQQSIVAQMLDVKIPEAVVAKVVNHPKLNEIEGADKVEDRDIRDALKKWQDVLKGMGMS